jgi:glycerol transport system ATP-binding protein
VISGLVQPTEGRVLYDGEDVTDLPPQRRNIAQVFQFPVIYDTMTVYENLAFPLKNRGMDSAGIEARVGEVAEMLDLTPHLGRRAMALAADAKQKISLGRGLVRSDVAAILFDEPLTVIDPHLKWQLRRKLKQIHERYSLTLVYVTHDQNEALTFADQVAVMVEGQIVQVGAPQELFEDPQHTFVGYFIGSPGMNILPCAVEPGAAVVDGQRIPLEGRLSDKAAAAGGALELGIRPEYLSLAESGANGAVPVAVNRVEDLGNFKIATLALGAHTVKAKLPEDQGVPGETAFLTFPPERTKLYADGRLVT